MKAVILAAGTGTRLGARGIIKPKGFLKFGDRPIVEESVLRLLRANVEEIVIVTGHKKIFYERLAQRYANRVVTIHNPLYAQSDSMYSLWLARAFLPDGGLLVESDLIYEYRALEELLGNPCEDVVLTSGMTGAGDEVYVEARGNRVTRISKEPEAADRVVGEFVGITKLSSQVFARMCRFAEERFRETLHVEYESEALSALTNEQLIEYHLILDLHWAEIDDPAHLARAEAVTYPAITRRDGRLEPQHGSAGKEPQ